ncbi:MAG TPA: SpoIVB peptidase S55 domain-containing protein [Thermoanaerobaculia bacterium]|nr:SpoIVB peptidase S55 domain-containing protein [Thermoanaerobaculia bacterium]
MTSVALLAAFLLAAGGNAEEILPLSSVVPGMKGYGLTVLEGQKVERFEVEVLGVIPAPAPGRSVIVVKASGLGLEKLGIAAGMSGSPIYLEGKLAGALSSGFPFSKEPVGGVTPIEPMLAIDESPPPPRGVRAAALPGAGTLLAAFVGGEEERLLLLRRRFEEMQALLPSPAASLLAPSWSGFPAETLVRSAPVLSRLGLPVAPAEAARAGPAPVPSPVAASPLAGGAAITALLVDGDLQLGATGTVTRVGPDGRFVAFGHPFLGFGELELPVAPAYVVTVLPSVYQSFKIGHALSTPSWRLTMDRDSGVAGRTDRSAPMVPVRFRFNAGATSRELNWRLAPHPRLLPLLLSISTDAALASADPTSRDRTIRFRVTFDTAAGPFTWEDLLTGPRARETAVLSAAVLAGLLADNEFEDPKISSLTIDVSSEGGERRLKILDAALASRKVAPGAELVATVRLADRRGEETARAVRLRVPRELPDGRATLVIGDGNVLSGLRIALNPGEPRTLADVRRWLERIVPGDRLAAAIVVSGRGAATGSDTLSALPPTTAALLSEGERSEGSKASLGSRIVAEEVLVLDRPVAGSVRLEFDVERPRS